MKRLGHIYDQIWSYENLVAAFAAVRRGHAANAPIRTFEQQLTQNLREISDALRAGNPQFGDYHFFTVFDPKERLICAAAVRERVIHHAVIRVCGAWMERSLIADCYACRKGYGQFKALDRTRIFLQRNPWFLKMDVRKYFDSIRHEILLELLTSRFKDKRLLDLFQKLLASYCTEPGCGLPIGNLTSHYFANLYLDGFDHFAQEQARVPGYVRYMDDMLAFGGREELLKFRENAGLWLLEYRGLTLKQQGGVINRCAHGVDFLGFHALPRSLRLNRRSQRRFVRKLHQYDAALACGDLSEEAYQQRSTALFSFVCHANTLAFRRRILGAGQGLQPGQTGRQLEQQREQLPGGQPEQQQPEQPEQQHRVSAGSLCSTMCLDSRRSSSRPASRSRLGAINKETMWRGAGSPVLSDERSATAPFLPKVLPAVQTGIWSAAARSVRRDAALFASDKRSAADGRTMNGKRGRELSTNGH